MKKPRIALTYLVIVIIGAIYALCYHLFIFPNNFAPAGLAGLCTMFQYVTGLNMGYMNLLLNLPLAFFVYRLVSKTVAVRALVYTGSMSLFLVLFEYVDLSALVYYTDNGTSIIMGPLVGGILGGSLLALLLQAGTNGGGTDYIAALVHKYRPDYNFFWVSFALNSSVALLSYFVYGFKIEPVLMCILYSFAISMVRDKLNQVEHSAVRFEIMTKHPEELSQAIIEKLHHSATLLPGKGIYRGEEVNVLICVVNKAQAPILASVIRSAPESFAVSGVVSQVIGNFKRLDVKGRQEVPILDPGENAEV